MKKNELPTPSAIIDLDILQQNIQSMAERAKQAGIKLRPHIKTHKTVEIANMQISAGAVGVTCAKVSEAEIMVNAGIHDILIAYPVVGDYQIEKIIELSKRSTITVGFDSFYGASRIHEAAMHAGIKVPLYMIINTGQNRDGVLPKEEALHLAKEVSSLSNVILRGIMTHEGHVYQAKDRQHAEEIVRDAARKMIETKEMLDEAGIFIEEVSMGSTPACRAGIAVKGITEWRPGTYVFNDVHELRFSTQSNECALTILATVVSHPGKNRFILDAGSKTLAMDKSEHQKGYGTIKEAPNAIIDRLSEEHGVVLTLSDQDLSIGQRVEVIPNHVCPVINLMNEVYVVQGDEVIDRWIVAARGSIR